MKKVLSLLLVTLLLVAAVPVFATGTDAEADDYKFIALFDAEDVTGSTMTNVFNFWNNYDANARANASSTNVRLSDYSAQMGPLGTGGNQYFHMLCFGDEGVDRTGYDYINFVIYSNTAITLPSYLVDATGVTGMLNDSGSNSGWLSLNQGWNVVTLGLNRRQNTDPNKADFAFADNTTIKEINIVVANDSTVIPTGVNLLNEGTKVKQQPNFSTACIYIDAIYLSKAAPTAPAVSGTSIANGATGISRNLDKYVVTFDSAMNAKSFTAETLTVKETATGTPVTVNSVTANGNTATIAFNEGSLAAGTEYTVTVSGTVNNAYGVELGDDAAFTFTTTPYELSGISNGETIYVNRFNEAVLTKTVGLNTTDNVASVTYYVDGTQKAVVNASPFTYDVEIADVNEHAVSATVVDTVGATHTLPAVTYSADFLASGNAAWTDNYDDETSKLTNQQPAKGTMTFVDDPATTNKRVGKVAYIDYTGSFAASSDDSCFVKSFQIPASKQVRIDFDVFVIDVDNQKIWMNIRPATYSYTGIGYQLSYDSTYYTKGAWNEVSVLIDYSQAGGAQRTTTYKVYINGVLRRETATNNTQFVEKGNKYTIHLMSQADYYIDNLKIYDYTASTVEAPAVGCVDFNATETGWDADVVLANLSDETSECTILTAVYDSSNNLIATDSEVVTVGAGKIVGKEYTIAKTQNGKTGAKVRAFVWESVEGALTLRPLAEIK